MGIATIYMSLIVLIPLAAIVVRSTDNGWSGFWNAITTPQAESALRLTIGLSLVVVAIKP